MSIDPAILASNRAERERLRALVARLSDPDLGRLLGPDWSVADALGHLAFWDRRAQVLLTKWLQSGEIAESPADVDTINDAVLFLIRRVAPRAAAEEAVAAAEAIDQLLETAPPKLIEQNVAAGGPLRLDRATHRRAHLDEIENRLGR